MYCTFVNGVFWNEQSSLFAKILVHINRHPEYAHFWRKTIYVAQEPVEYSHAPLYSDHSINQYRQALETK